MNALTVALGRVSTIVEVDRLQLPARGLCLSQPCILYCEFDLASVGMQIYTESFLSRGSPLRSRRVRTRGDVIFELSLAAFGVPVGIGSRGRLRCLSLLFCSASLITVPLGGPYSIYKEVSECISTTMGLADLVAAIGTIWYTIISIYSSFVLLRRGRKIEPLFRQNGRRFAEMIVFIIFFAQIMISHVAYMLGDRTYLYIVETAGFARLTVNFLIVDVTYFDAVQALLERLRLLHDESRRSVLDWRYLVGEKWKIRDRIDLINSLFADLLSGFYIYVFLWAAFVWTAVIKNAPAHRIVFLMSTPFFMYSITLFVLAQQASAVKSQCEKTEAGLMRRLQEDPKLHDADIGSMEHLRFREDWDSLRIGCFNHGEGNFLRFLSMVATSIAVMLQFDYVVVRTIQDLARRSLDS